jgi:hypothetical protein
MKDQESRSTRWVGRLKLIAGRAIDSARHQEGMVQQRNRVREGPDLLSAINQRIRRGEKDNAID